MHLITTSLPPPLRAFPLSLLPERPSTMKAGLRSPEARMRGKTKSKKVTASSTMAVVKAKKVDDRDPVFGSASTPSTPTFRHGSQTSSSGSTNRQKRPNHRLNHAVKVVEEVPLSSPVVGRKRSNELNSKGYGRNNKHQHQAIETKPSSTRTSNTRKKSPLPTTRSFNSISSGEITVPRSNTHTNSTQSQSQMESVLDELRRIYVTERFHHRPYNTFFRQPFADVSVMEAFDEDKWEPRKEKNAIQSPLTPYRRDVSSQKQGIRGSDLETEVSPRGVTESLSPSRRARYLNERKLQKTPTSLHKKGIKKSLSERTTIQTNRLHQTPSSSHSPSGSRRHRSPSTSTTTSTRTPIPHRYLSSPFLQSPVKVRRSSVSTSPQRRPRSHSPHSNTCSSNTCSSNNNNFHLSKQLETRSLRGDRTTGTDTMKKHRSSAKRYHDRMTSPTKSRSASTPIQKSKMRSKMKSSCNDREGIHQHHQHRQHSHHNQRQHDRSTSPVKSHSSSPSIRVRRTSKTPSSDASRISTSHHHHHQKQSSRLSHGGNYGGRQLDANVLDLQSPSTPTRRGRRPCRSKSPSAADTAAADAAVNSSRVQPNNNNKTLPANYRRVHHSSEKRRDDRPDGFPLKKKKAIKTSKLKSLSAVTSSSRSLSPRHNHQPTAATSPRLSHQYFASPVVMQPQAWPAGTTMTDENRATHHRPQRDYAGSIDWRSLSPRIHEGKLSSLLSLQNQEQHHARSPVPSTGSTSVENRTHSCRDSEGAIGERPVKANFDFFDKDLTLALVRKWNEVQIATAVVESIQAKERRFHESHGSGSISSPSARSNRSSNTSGSHHRSGISRSNRGADSGYLPRTSIGNAIAQQQQRLCASLGDGDANDEYMSQAKHRNEVRRHSFASLQDYREGGGGDGDGRSAVLEW